jgi:hypothetical protein
VSWQAALRSVAAAKVSLLVPMFSQNAGRLTASTWDYYCEWTYVPSTGVLVSQNFYSIGVREFVRPVKGNDDRSPRESKSELWLYYTVVNLVTMLLVSRDLERGVAPKMNPIC